MKLGLDDRVALVCGSSRGLGRAVAEELAREGAEVALCARTKGTLEDAAAAIGAATGKAPFTVVADLSQRGQPTRVVEECLEHFGRLDILVTNSGGPPAGSFEALRLDDWQAASMLLISSVVELVARALPGMKTRGWGRILAIGSIAAREPVADLILSNSFRPAVSGLTHALAREVAEAGITVNSILPGFTNTERVRELYGHTAGATAAIEQTIALGRLAEPEEFAALAAFLVSERASYITGVAFAVDGGWLRGI